MPRDWAFAETPVFATFVFHSAQCSSGPAQSCEDRVWPADGEDERRQSSGKGS